MAKELPYFKFEPNEWENGNIQMLTRDDKGLFIDLCSMYWSRLGNLPFKLAVQKLCGGNASAFDSLNSCNIFEVIDDHVYIKFLSEQLLEFDIVSKKNSQNAKDGWLKRKSAKALSERNATASNSQCETNAIREEEIREEKIKEEEIKEKNILSKKNFSTESEILGSKENLPLEPEKKEKEKNLAPKKEKEPTEHWEDIVEFWFGFYETHFKIKPTFNGSDAKSLKNIILILRKRSIEKGYQWSKETATNAFNHFLSAAITDTWLLNNFLLKNLDSQFDKILNLAINGKRTPTSIETSSYEQDLARRIAEAANQ